MRRMLFLGLTASAAISLTVVSIWVFYPGLMTYDSFRQYEQAISGHFDDRHPPALSLLWRVFIEIADGPQSILSLNQVLYWSGWFLTALFCWRRTQSLIHSIPIVFIGAFPLLYVFSGTIWKDVVLAVSWLICAALLLNLADRSTPAFTRYAGLAVAVVTLVFGSMLRYNSLPAAALLAIGVCLVTFTRPSDRVISSCLLIGFLAIAPLALSNLVRATATHPFTQLVIFDLAGISVHAGQNYLHPQLELQPLLFKCYSPRSWEVFSDGECKTLTESIYAAAYSVADDNYIANWAKIIIYEPIAYMKHRLWYFSNLLRFGCIECKQYMWATHTDPDPLGFLHRSNFIFRNLLFVAGKLGSTLLGRPYFWLVASVVLAFFHWRQDRSYSLILALISASGAAYLVSYLIAGIADDFRYAYWTMFTVAVCTAVPLSVAQRPLKELWNLGLYLAPPILVTKGLDYLLKGLAPID